LLFWNFSQFHRANFVFLITSYDEEPEITKFHTRTSEREFLVRRLRQKRKSKTDTGHTLLRIRSLLLRKNKRNLQSDKSARYDSRKFTIREAGTSMIFRLQHHHLKSAVRLLETAPAFNLYLLGNLETLGLDHEMCEFWGDFGADGTIRAVLNRYMTGWTIYGDVKADWPGLAAVIDNHPMPATRLQDNPGGTPSLLPYLKRYRAENVHVEELMMLDSANFQPRQPDRSIHVRRANLSDLPTLIEVYADADHMSRSAAAVERPLRDTRLWLAERDGRILSTALTNAETCKLAMIGGVYTPPAYRGQRLSQAVCSALCADLLAENKRPILYWDTPAAGAVYRKLGFSTVGQWRSVWLIRN
jgi:N-acetylglutamate synthase-like GNAT family acetyltransferase